MLCSIDFFSKFRIFIKRPLKGSTRSTLPLGGWDVRIQFRSVFGLIWGN